MLLTTPTQGLSGATGPSSVRTLEYEQDVSPYFAPAYCGDFRRCANRVPRRAMRFHSDGRGGQFERPFGVRVSGVRAAPLLQWVAGIIRRCADRIMPHSCVCSR